MSANNRRKSGKKIGNLINKLGGANFVPIRVGKPPSLRNKKEAFISDGPKIVPHRRQNSTSAIPNIRKSFEKPKVYQTYLFFYFMQKQN